MKRYLSLLMGILGFVPILAQQSDYYYYYKGNRIDLTVDSTRLYVVSEGELQLQSTTRSADPQIVKSVKSNIRNQVVPLQKQRAAFPEIYFSTLNVPEGQSPAQYAALVAKVKAADKVLQVLPSFTINGNRIDVTNNFYVKLKTASDLGKLQQLAASHSLDIVGNNPFLPLWYTLSCTSSSSMDAIEAANLFSLSGLFECSEPEISFYNTSSVDIELNDEFYEEQWALHNYNYPGIDINIEGAWSITKGDGVIVAIVDDGIAGSNKDFWNKIYDKSYDAATNSSPATRYGEHGTYCAGVLGAAQNDFGISGVAPNCTLMPVSIDFYSGVSIQQAVNAVSWAWKNDADIMSCSWGYNEPSEMLSNAVDSALTYGREGKGCILVFASGNKTQQNLSNEVSFPANSDSRIIAVGASKPCGERVGDRDSSCCAGSFIPWGSCYGEELDVVAPGIYITTTTTAFEHWTEVIHDFGGTSAACPHVAGIAALILSVNPDLPVEAVDFIIGKTARKVRTDLYSYQKDALHKHGTWNEKVGYGLADATAAVEMAIEPTVYVWRQSRYEEDEGYYDVAGKNIDVKDITVTSGEVFHIFKDKGVILRSSVLVEEGGELIIFERLEE